MATTIISPVILILRKFRKEKNQYGFLLTLLLIFNTYFGCYGIYIIVTGQGTQSGPFLLSLFALNLMPAGLLMYRLTHRG